MNVLPQTRDTLATLAYDRIAKTCAELGLPLTVGHEYPVVEGTGTAVAHVLTSPTWATQGGTGSALGKTLVLNLYVDRTRQPVLLDDAEAKAEFLFSQIDPLLDGQRASTWAEILFCELRSVETLPIPQGDGAVLMSCRYSAAVWKY